MIWTGVVVAALVHLPGSSVGAQRAGALAIDHAALIVAATLASAWKRKESDPTADANRD